VPTEAHPARSPVECVESVQLNVGDFSDDFHRCEHRDDLDDVPGDAVHHGGNPAKSVSIVAAPTKMANVSGPNRINDPTKTAAVVA